MSKQLFSILKNIESLFQVNESLKCDPATFEKHKHVVKQSIGEIQTSINNGTPIQIDVLRNVLIACKIKPNLGSNYQQMMLDILRHSKQQHDILSEVLVNFPFTNQSIQDVLYILSTLEDTKAAQELILKNKSLMLSIENIQEPEKIVSAMKKLLQISKSSQLTEESVADFQYFQYEFWLKSTNQKLENKNHIYDLLKVLQNKLDWMLKSGKQIDFDYLLLYLRNFKRSTEVTFSDIIAQKYQEIELLTLFNLLKEQEEFEKIKICNYIKQNKERYNLSQTYQLFTQQQVIDLKLLQEIEESIQNEKINQISLLQFYSTVPLTPSWKIAQILRNKITKEWDTSSITMKLDIVGYLYRIERLTEKPLPFVKYQILDSMLVSKIEEMILGLRFEDLKQLDRFKVYFIMNCYYSKDLLSSYFNTQYALYIQAYLNNQFSTQPRIQSNLQKQIEESLIKSQAQYEREKLVENCFAVDFKIRNTIIEVNGPHHYCYLIGQELPKGMIQHIGSNKAIFETLKTTLKTQILCRKGYKVINIPYFKWAGWTMANKHDRILSDMLSGISLKDSELLSKI